MTTDRRQDLALSRIVLTVFTIFLFYISPAFAQEQASEPSQESSPEEQEVAPGKEEAFEKVTDAERIIHLEKVLNLDREKLTELKADLLDRQELFNMLGNEVIRVTDQLEEKRTLLQALEESSDPKKRSGLEREIAELEVELDLERDAIRSVLHSREDGSRADPSPREETRARRTNSLKALREGGEVPEQLRRRPPLRPPRPPARPPAACRSHR